MIFADLPYNVRITPIVGRGKIKHREFASAFGEMSPDEFTSFLARTFSLAAQYSIDGSIHFVCMDWRHLSEALDAGKGVYTELKNMVVWVKTNAGQGSFYRSQHEHILVFKNGDGPHQNNIELGRHGRSRSNVWTYAGVKTQALEQGKTSLIVISGCRTGGGKSLLLRSHTSPPVLSTPYYATIACMPLVIGQEKSIGTGKLCRKDRRKIALSTHDICPQGMWARLSGGDGGVVHALGPSQAMPPEPAKYRPRSGRIQWR